MATGEWSLLLFTLLAQTSVGAYIVWELPVVFRFSNPLLKNDQNLRPYLIFTGIAVLALFISFFHLGNPLRAIYSLSNFKESWLSREILFASLFTWFMALTVILDWTGTRLKPAGRLISVLSIISGLALVFSMAKIYMLPTVPTWNSPYTIIEFFTTAFILGLLLAAYIAKTNSTRKSSAYFLTILLFLLFLKLATHLFITFLIPEIFTGLLLVLNTLRAVTLIVAAILLVGWLFKKNPSEKIFQGKVSYLLSILILISEIAGRYLFYAGFMSVGI